MLENVLTRVDVSEENFQLQKQIANNSNLKRKFIQLKCI